ncbi:MAG: hypothetical protein Q7S66_04710 [bacterium]|nr:hypothetical protein [bacterium]
MVKCSHCHFEIPEMTGEMLEKESIKACPNCFAPDLYDAGPTPPPQPSFDPMGRADMPTDPAAGIV